ncbi:hypothetical protein [Sphingosinicella terrae]|uniref:hypothetical protein n=1 Tax=Sphingosinicella terrae TaxID=2172047 RepID=UPI000E0CD191|nr:hypothetical protein [Sphingosinicella terrae]
MALHAGFECVADFPDDMIEEDDEIVVLGGRLIAEALADMLREKDLEVEDPQLHALNGWEVYVTLGKREHMVLVTDLGDFTTIQIVDVTPFWRRFGGSKSDFWDFVRTVHELVASDPRFSNIEWMRGLEPAWAAA